MRPLVALSFGLLLAPLAHAGKPPVAKSAAPARKLVESGTFRFKPLGAQKDIPARYQLKERTFTYEMDIKTRMAASGVTVYRLRFPSPVKSATPENNTVHAEYYRPRGKGPFPGVIVLDVTAGRQILSRNMATIFARNGVAGLFVQMAYYGPRRPPGSKLRLLSPNVPQTIKAITQTVLDLRVATAWMESRRELDRKRLGIVGTSLGSFLSALTGEMEPKLGRVVVLLGGGGFVDAYYDDPRGKAVRRLYEAIGGTKEKAKKVIAPVDPLTCAANLKKRKLLIIAASKDNIVPPKMAKALWEASGKQKIVWYETNHYGAALYIADGLKHILKHFKGG
jgi:dienelactone hydrolase